DGPEWIGVNPKTGAVYVHTKNRLVKYSGWKKPEEQASIDLAPFYKGLYSWRKDRQRFSFAIDASGDQPILWIGQTMKTPALQFCKDSGTTFNPMKPAGNFISSRHERPASDPLHKKILCKFGVSVQILDEKTGTITKVRPERGKGNNQGTTHRLDREGNIYCASASGGVWKCDPKGKRIPFPATAEDPKLKGHIPGGSTGTTAWERDFYIDRKGDIYAKVRGTSYHGLMHVDVFGPDGTKKHTALWGVTDGSYGPRVDPQGNIYMMECIKPVGQPFPDVFKPFTADRMVHHWYDWIYGSIVKFSPAGGNIWLNTRRKEDKPGAEPVKLPDSFKKEKIYATFRSGESLMQGALWYKPGVAHCGDMGVCGGGNHCHCTGCDFDVDNFGRSFAPDNGRQRVTVFDTNGNTVLHFGAYGNQDYCGPDSYVMDPKGKFLRPRIKDDPKDVVSPFAKPEIAFNFIIGLAVTDRYAYVADCANRRMLRCSLGYAAEEICSIK
ncbi:hypothetical protein ACFL6F_02945, partial [Planctomycetota bacterium]